MKTKLIEVKKVDEENTNFRLSLESDFVSVIESFFAENVTATKCLDKTDAKINAVSLAWN